MRGEGWRWPRRRRVAEVAGVDTGAGAGAARCAAMPVAAVAGGAAASPDASGQAWLAEVLCVPYQMLERGRRGRGRGGGAEQFGLEAEHPVTVLRLLQSEVSRPVLRARVSSSNKATS